MICDTSILFALFSRGDEHHPVVSARLKRWRDEGREVVIPRIAWIEMLGHITRELPADAEPRKMAAWSSERLGQVGAVADHRKSDYDLALEQWKRYADWPIEYPDALIVATALRMGKCVVWTIDADLRSFMHAEPPEVACAEHL